MSDDAGSFDEPTVLTNLTGEAGGTHPQPSEAAAAPTPSGPVEPASVRAGEVFAGRYRLEQQLAHRGGTLTWRAFDQKLSRSVLVHVLAPRDPRTPSVLEAARTAAVATDSRFLRVLDAVEGDADRVPSLIVCEYAPGQSLEQLLQSGPLSALESAWIVRELADALAVMHDVGLFHERLNPDTVIITATGNVKIVGFLIEAALHPAEHANRPWAQREATDVLALGKLLYASLVAMWPAAAPGTETWGLPMAPTDARGWVMPRALNSGVSPALDAVCDQVLSPSPRHQEMPLSSAKQVAAALGRVLGTADAAADLERRLRFPMTPVHPSTSAAVAAGHQAVAGATVRRAEPPHPVGSPASRVDADGSATATHAAATDPSATDHDSTALYDAFAEATDPNLGRYRRPDSTEHTGRIDDEGDDTTPAGEPHAGDSSRGAPLVGGRSGRRVEHGRQRAALALVGLVLLSLVIGLLGLFLHTGPAARHDHATTTASGGASSTAAAPGTVWAITHATDFDPSADGGNGEENPGELPLAHDGNPATAWKTVTYWNSAKLGNSKPGVGIVLDLGQARQIGKVSLTLQGQPTGVQIMVPTAANATSAPMNGVKSWRSIATNPAAGTSVTLTPTTPVTSRFVLVYLTSLPKIANARYRGAIAEVQVLS